MDRSSPEESLPPLVVICGATATGKTALSLELADAIGNAEIISADSRQVYRGMDIGTAKATRADRERVPHHGLDLVDPDEPFNVADYQRHALDALRNIARRRHIAIIVGGTGLYLRVVARGYELPGVPPDPEFRSDLEDLAEDEGLDALVNTLVRVAPRAAERIDLRNPRRVIRALERARAFGDRPERPPAGYPGPTVWLGLRLDSAQHRLAIEQRAYEQFSNGLLDEVASLRERYSIAQPAFSAFGYREAMSVVTDDSDVETAIGLTAQRTWAYARRQRTWFRAERDVHWLDAADSIKDALAAMAHAGIS